jgi:hypothetical protein
VAVYEGSPGDSIRGAMGLMGGIFAPDHYDRWPKLDRRDPAYLIDLHPPPGTVARVGPSAEGAVVVPEATGRLGLAKAAGRR